jgi:hypothetical protein
MLKKQSRKKDETGEGRRYYKKTSSTQWTMRGLRITAGHRGGHESRSAEAKNI